MNNMVCLVTVSFIIGIIIGHWESYSNILSVLIFSAGAITVVSFLLYKKYKKIYIMTLPLFIIFGFIRTVSAFQPANWAAEYIAENEEEVEIRGVVYDIGKEYGSQYTLFIQSECISNRDYIINESIGLKCVFDKSDKFYVGDIVKFSGRLIKTDTLRNPGGFNERDYYKLKNIEYKVYSDSVLKIGEEKNLKILLKKLNIIVSNVYNDILPKEEAAVIKAMITGDKTDLSYSVKDLFSRVGIYHIIAISGLHIHMLAHIILFLSERFHKRYGKVFAMFFVILYCVFTGAGVSSIRAVCMFLIYICGKFFYREYDVLTSLFISGFLILLFNPLYLFDVGFQYSFCAVLSLIIFSPIITEIFRKKFSYRISEVLSAAISVNFIPKAVVWFNFFGTATLDIFANLIIIPFSGIVVFLGFISGILGLFSVKIAGFLSGMVYVILKFYEFLCEIIEDIPFSYVLLGKPSTSGIITYLLIIFAVSLYLYKWISGKCILYFIVIIISINLLSFKKSELKITMLDVGQGDSFVFDYNDKCFIIDGGGDYKRELGEGTGKNVLYPYLKYMGTDYVDAIFITHTDADHIKGIIEILDYVKTGKIYVSNKNDESDLYKILCEKARMTNTEIVEICSGARIKFRDDIIIDCIYPYSSDMTGNDASLVLKVVFDNTSFLFTGDISAECEKEIIDSGENIKVDVLKLSHHGSKYSNSGEFIEKVNPKLAIVSAGSFAMYGQPAKEIVNKLENENVTVLNTREKGAVEIYSDGKGIYYKTMK